MLGLLWLSVSFKLLAGGGEEPLPEFADPPDSTPPFVRSTNPDVGVSGANIAGAVTITFSEAMDDATLTTNTLALRNSVNALVPTSILYHNATRTASLVPRQLLATNALYTVTVTGGGAGVKDLAGNAMAASQAWSFTTVSANPHGSGPGGPILILTTTNNAFTSYYAEILQAEGLNLFALRDIATVSSNTLNAYDLVLLGNLSLTTNQAGMVSNYVVNGGNLIAFRPDKKLAELFGLTDAGSTLAEAYLRVTTNQSPGAGIVGETMQFHGTADRYNLAGATNIATLYSSSTTATANPAVTWRTVGANGGRAAAFTYDLARSIVFTRQGNPAWAGQDRDGNAPLRPNDLFYGNASFDPKSDWVNLAKLGIPQADEQQRLLVNLITQMNLARRPLPRFWYFPDQHKAVIVMTGDDHGGGGTIGRFNQYNAISPPGASADWATIRGSSYVFSSTPITDAQAAAFEMNSFEIGLHVNTDCSNYTTATFDAFVASQLNAFRSAYPSLPSPTTHRIHCIAWSGYTIAPEVQFKYGMRLDVNYYHFPGSWIGSYPGFMTGSGLPMRFATTTGTLINVYQVATQMTDESNQNYPYTSDALLDRALGPEGYFGAFAANMHTDFPGSAESDAILNSAVRRGVPVIAAEQLLDWVDARNRSYPTNLQWNANTLTFTLQADANARGLQVLVPVPTGLNATQVRSNGIALAFAPRQLKGQHYVQFPGADGNYEINFSPDTTPPALASLSPADGQIEVRTNAVIRVKFSEAVLAASVGTNTFSLANAFANPVPLTVTFDAFTQEAIVTPNAALSPAQTYTLTIQGGVNGVRDLAGQPLSPTFQSSFTTELQPTVTLWSDANHSTLISDVDTNAVELGLKFRSSNSGYITGIRFYKGPANVGPHTANLWTESGTPLASAVFTSESSLGWQEQKFSQPVPIQANTPYVASYHSPAGHYASSGNYFTTGVDNFPLHALSDSEAGGNGVYGYGPSNFPTNSYRAANYWVDVMFQAGAVSNTAPTAGDLAALLPEDTATNLFLPGSDAEGSITYSILAAPTNGTVSSLNASTGSFIYRPATNYFGPDAFLYRVSDGSLFATGTVSLTVAPVSDPPVAAGLALTIPEDTVTNLFLPGSDAESAVTFALVANPTNGTLSGFNPSTGTVTYQPMANYVGADAFRYRVTDGSQWATGLVSLAISAVDDPPQADSQSLTLPANSATNLTLTASDNDTIYNSVLSEVLAASAVNTPDNWTLEAGSDKVSAVAVNDGDTSYITSSPNSGTQQQFTLTDPVTVQAGDVIQSVTLRATVKRVTQSCNHFLTAVLGASTAAGTTRAAGSSYTTSSDTFTSRPGGGAWTVADLGNLQGRIQNSQGRDMRCTRFDALVSATRVTGPTNVTFALLLPPAHGTLTGWNPATGAATYTPATNYVGTDSFTFTATSGGNTSTGAVNLVIVGTKPPLVSPQILGIALENGIITLTWSAVPGHHYTLEAAADFADAWMPAQPGTVATNSTMTATLAIGTQPQRIFRVHAVEQE